MAYICNLYKTRKAKPNKMAAMFSFARSDERSGRGWRRGGRVRRRSTTPTRRGGGAATRPSTTSTGTRRRIPCGRITATFTKFLAVFSNSRYESGSGWMSTHSAFSMEKKTKPPSTSCLILTSVHNIRRVPGTPRDPQLWLLRILIRGSIPNLIWIRNTFFLRVRWHAAAFFLFIRITTYHPRTELSEKLSLSLHINPSTDYQSIVYERLPNHVISLQFCSGSKQLGRTCQLFLILFFYRGLYHSFLHFSDVSVFSISLPRKKSSFVVADVHGLIDDVFFKNYFLSFNFFFTFSPCNLACACDKLFVDNVRTRFKSYYTFLKFF